MTRFGPGRYWQGWQVSVDRYRALSGPRQPMLITDQGAGVYATVTTSSVGMLLSESDDTKASETIDPCTARNAADLHAGIGREHIATTVDADDANSLKSKSQWQKCGDISCARLAD